MLHLPSVCVGAATAFLSVGIVGWFAPDTLAVSAVSGSLIWFGIVSFGFAIFMPERKQ
jgi:hypothetical protein